MSIQEWEISQLVIGVFKFHVFKRSDGTYRSEPSPEPHNLFSVKQDLAKPEFVAEFESKSTPGMKHHVYRNSDGSLFCTCTGNRRYGHCWHVDKVIKSKE